MQVCIFYYPIIVVCTNGVEHAHIRRNTKVISCFTHSLILHLLCVYWHKCGCVEQRRHMAGCPSSIWRCTLSSNVSKMHNTGKWQTALTAYGDALFLHMYPKCTIQANGRQPFRHMEMHYFFKCIKNAQYRQMAGSPSGIWRRWCTVGRGFAQRIHTGAI